VKLHGIFHAKLHGIFHAKLQLLLHIYSEDSGLRRHESSSLEGSV
jgi:hypothetical protein